MLNEPPFKHGYMTHDDKVVVVVVRVVTVVVVVVVEHTPHNLGQK